MEEFIKIDLLNKEIRKHKGKITNLKEQQYAERNYAKLLNQEISELKTQLNTLNQENTELRRQNKEKDEILKDANQINKIQENELIQKNNQLREVADQAQFIDHLPQTQLILSAQGDSKELSVKKTQQGLEFRNDNYSAYSGQAYLNFILNPSVNYIIQVELQQTKGQDKWFWFGLVPDSKKDTTWGELYKLCYCEQNGDCGINNFIKGQSILIDDNSLENKSLEIRINIQNKILRVGSLPNYYSVVEASYPERLDAKVPFRFFVEGLNEQTKMTITKIIQVGKFNSMM